MKSNAYFLSGLLLILTSCDPNFFKIPTPSMEATIPVGSRVFVNTAKPYKHYDIICFQWPGQEVFYISRILGMPGDILEIRESAIFQNDRHINDTTTIQHTYFIETDQILKERIFTEKGIRDFTYRSDGYHVFATKEAIEKFKNNPAIKSINQIFEPVEYENTRIFADFQGKSWNTDYFGPLLIPHKGLTIELNDENRKLYKTIIEKYEKTDLRSLQNYTFQNDYLFVLSDNRHNALDSRYLGFVPAENIHGIAYKYKLF